MEVSVPRGYRHIFTISLAALIAAACGPLLPSGSASGEDDLSSAHVSAAVQKLFDVDQERVDDTRQALDRQDVVRQEIAVCIDPSARWLSCEVRLWVESPLDRVRLLLDESLRVLTVRDSRGGTLAHVRTGDVLEVRAAAGATRFPLEMELSYEGSLSHSVGAWVDDDVVVLGPDFHWYPVSDARDAARLRVEARYPTGYSSVVSGTLAGMAPTLTGQAACSEGDVWEVPTPVTGATIVVGRLESSLTVVGDVFFGYHALSSEGAGELSGACWGSSPSSVPQELIELLRFAETCFGPYPYEWLNVVRLPAGPGRPSAVVAGPGLVVVRDGGRPGPPADMPLGHVVSGLAQSWWTFWIDPGRVVSASLAIQAEAEWLDATGDEDGAARLRGRHRAQYMRAVHDLGRGISLLECLGPDGYNDQRVCGGKGSAVFEILKSVVGQRAYCAALRTIASEHGGEPVGVREFVEAFEGEHGQDLDWFFYEWMSRGDLPLYAIEYEASPVGDGSYVVRGLIRQEGEPFHTPLPLTIDLGGWAYDETVAIESSHQPFEIRTDAEPVQVTVDERHLIPKMNREELAAMHLELGAAAADSGDWGAAVDEFGAAAGLEPENASYVHAYAGALVQHGRLKDGLAAIDRAIELDPANLDMRFEAAGLHLRSGDPAAALRHLDAYVAEAPYDAAGRVARARALVELGRIDEAERGIEQVRQSLPSEQAGGDLDEEMLLVTGRIHELRGDTAAAIRAYEAALAANPVSDEARRRIRALNLPEVE
jgi:tetratricopeptide (TPR) repeat protein